jgi:hypothetical protein
MSTLDERLKTVHRKETAHAAAADERAEKALDAAASVRRDTHGPGATPQALRDEERHHEGIAKDERHKARVHRRRAAIAGHDGSGDYPQTADEMSDPDFDVEHGDTRVHAYRASRVHHGPALDRED